MAGGYSVEDGSQEKSGQSDELFEVRLLNSEDDVNWDDCDEKMRSLFDQALKVLFRGVYAKNGIRPIPALLGDGRSVDLFKLFCLVRDRGGFCSVSEEKLWGLIAERCGFDYKLGPSLKLIYFKYLDELDQCLDRISGDKVSSNGSYQCSGNLGLLSLEFEKRFRDFSTAGKELVHKDNEVGFELLSEDIGVAFKENLYLENVEINCEERSGVTIYSVDDDDKFSSIKECRGKENQCAFGTPPKRKRDVFAEMLGWMLKVSKNPCQPCVGRPFGLSRWKETEVKVFRSVALSVREARLRKRFTVSNDEQSPYYMKKNKMHPSMYEDNILGNQHCAEGLRSSRRLLSLVKSPSCHCCKQGSVENCELETRSSSPRENGCCKQQLTKADIPAKKIIPKVTRDDSPVRNHVLVGPKFQAEVPVWSGVMEESDSKWLGTRTWVPDSEVENPLALRKFVGKGRSESCDCPFPGSVECHRFHIAENRLKIRREIGLAFFHWKFDSMGEEVSLSWSDGDQMRFKHVIRLSIPNLGKKHFPKKRYSDLVRYYFNVYLINRRSYQNRVTPKNIDSDDEIEFGSVGEPFGAKAVKFRRSESLTCSLNEQVTELD